MNYDNPLWQITRMRSPLVGVTAEQFEDSLERLWRFLILHEGTDADLSARRLVATHLLSAATTHGQTGTNKIAYGYLLTYASTGARAPENVDPLEVIPRYVRIAQNDPRLFHAVRESLPKSPHTFRLRYVLWLIQTVMEEESNAQTS